MSSMRTIAVCVAVAVLALSAGYATHVLLADGTMATGVSDASDVEALWKSELPDVNGVRISVAHWRGSVLVVNFWATWCAPCREEMPSFVALQSELAGKGVQFIGIAADQADKVDHFAKELGINYPLLVGGMEVLDLSTKLGNRISALPFTVVLDRQGRIVHRQLGILKPDKLRALIAKMA
jgi:thiol-disulfide isomerase/thioredoxin